MEQELNQFIDLIPRMTGSFATVLIFYFLYRAGILGAIVSWIKKEPNNEKIANLEAFRAEAESNHWHDIEDLKEDRKDIWKVLGLLQRDIAKIQADVANINGRLQEGRKNQ